MFAQTGRITVRILVSSTTENPPGSPACLFCTRNFLVIIVGVNQTRAAATNNDRCFVFEGDNG